MGKQETLSLIISFLKKVSRNMSMCRNCFLIFVLIYGISGASLNTYRLESILDGLHDALQYMEDHVSEINLDAVFSTRRVQEQLEAYLYFEPEVFRIIWTRVEKLKDKARNISDVGQEYVLKRGGKYAEEVGPNLKHFERLLWHPSRNISLDYVVTPEPCSSYYYDWKLNDYCFGQISENKSKKKCKVSDVCKNLYSAPNKRGYYLTHQLLFWEQLKMKDCKYDISQDLITYLCSNIMRDAEEIAAADYPQSSQDLFIEQIGLCGMWGFKDFYKPEWIKKILQWQNPSGCFNVFVKFENWICKDHLVPDGKTRRKREEKLLEDGCLTHKTGVALIALTTSLRFEAEKLYQQM